MDDQRPESGYARRIEPAEARETTGGVVADVNVVVGKHQGGYFLVDHFARQEEADGHSTVVCSSRGESAAEAIQIKPGDVFA